MSTLLRLLKFSRRFHASATPRLTFKVKFKNSAAPKALMQTQTVLSSSTNRSRHHATLVQSSVKQNEQPENSSMDRKMEQISKEINYHGRISKFNVEDIVDDIKKFGKVTSLQGLFLLRICSELIDNKSPKLRREMGEDIWKTLKDFGVQLDVSHYNALLAIYLETDHEFSTEGFLEEMISSNVKPNRVTFQRLIASLCHKGKVMEANQIFEHMKNEQIPVNENVFSSFIYGHCINSNTEAVIKTMEEMKTVDIKPTINTYSSFLYAYAQKGDIDNIRKTLKDCESNDLWISGKVFLRMIYHLSVNGFEQHIDEILELTPKSAEYEKEAVKTIYKLVEKQKVEDAFKVYLSLPEKKNNEGTFFVQTLVNLDVPVEKSVQYCRQIEEMEMNQKAFVAAIKRSLENDMFESSFTLMKAWKDIGGEIKEHFFYPVLKAFSQSKDSEGIKKVLQKMIFEFGIDPSVKLLSCYFLPYVSQNADEAYSALIDLPLENSKLANSILLFLLSKNEIQEVVRFLSLNSTNYWRNTIKNPLIEAFRKTEDVPSFVWILHYLYVKALNESAMSNVISINFLDSCISEVIDFLAENKYLNLMFFRNIHERGLSISRETSDNVLKVLGDDMPKQIFDILRDLQSGELIPKPIQRISYGHTFNVKKSVNIGKLENINLQNLDSNSVAASCIKMKALVFYCCSLKEDKASEIIEDFQRTNRHLTEPVYAVLIHMYMNLGKIEQAEHWLEEARRNFPNFRINKIVNLKLITGLVERGEIKKALEQFPWSMHSSAHRYLCVKLLYAVSKLNDEELLQRFFDQLYIHGYITKMCPSLMAPFVEFYVARNDGKAGYEKCKWLYHAYGQIPFPTPLMKNLIEKGDFETLEQLTLFYTDKFGETKSYFQLAVAYLENNDLEMAKNIIMNHCLDLSEKMVLYFAEHYYNTNQIGNLENLFTVLYDSKYDVECLCLLLLKSYTLQNNWDKCYELWIKMQEENIKLPANFFSFLDEVIKNRLDHSTSSLKKFHDAVQKFDFHRARKILDCLPTVYKSECYSQLCRKYVSVGIRLSEVLDLWRDLRERYNMDLNYSTAEYVLSKLLDARDVMSIEKVGLYMSPELKRDLNHAYYLNKAYLLSGSWNLYLKKLESQLDEKNFSHENLNIHYKTTIYALLRYPDVYEQFEALAYKYSAKNIHNLLYVLWAFNFLEKNPKADKLWTYVTNPKLFFEMKIMYFLQNHNDLSLYVKLSEFVHQSSFNNNVKLRIYSNIIESCMGSGDPNKYEYSMKCLQQGVLDIPMEQFSIDLLAELQKGLEESGKPWPWSAKQFEKNNEISSV